MKKALLTALLILTVSGISMTAQAAPKTMPDGTTFDAEYYAGRYPDVVAVYGTEESALYDHYITYGKQEGRDAAAPETASDAESAVSAAVPAQAVNETAAFQPVAVDKLANLSSIKKKMTNEELNQAYNVALGIVTPLAGLSREEQLAGIASALRSRFDAGMTYSMSETHYNDPYGYFILGTASCAGCARATGLCLNILGIPYEHVNENQYNHQWCRVNVNGTYWICDAFGLYCAPEPAPYDHPLAY